jgi:hypothetical protein
MFKFVASWRARLRRARMNAAEEQRINLAKAELRRVQHAVETGSTNWDAHISAARAIVASVNSTSLMQRADRPTDQAFIIAGLQNLAYHDADSGGVQDIADWCVTQWLKMIQRDPENVHALKGIPRCAPFPPFHQNLPQSTSGLRRDQADNGKDWVGHGCHERNLLLLEYIAKKVVPPVAEAVVGLEPETEQHTLRVTRPETRPELQQKQTLDFTLPITSRLVAFCSLPQSTSPELLQLQIEEAR